jgi:uncharacterized protein (DUF934 family)
MTEKAQHAETRIWTPSGFVEDCWHKCDRDDRLPREGKAIIPLPVYVGLSDVERAKACHRIGVLIEPSDTLESVAAYLHSIPLIALSFPTFSDGRSYSKAALLKGRYGFDGLMRATGDVLIDQIALMIRVGFDEFEISNEVAIARLAEGWIGGVDLHYQPGRAGETKSNNFSWRRRAA